MVAAVAAEEVEVDLLPETSSHDGNWSIRKMKTCEKTACISSYHRLYYQMRAYDC